ncbi:addiction module protein [Bradyrhizobium sp. SRS-191]|uniref:addiction module protein n=1 Tax=Bradyrhizobium sp. SRS-191 TaxID=2962606 RepID=UPI00211F072B|nr:addiction module protein [Bradyrhizobium sp. SRS-191]
MPEDASKNQDEKPQITTTISAKRRSTPLIEQLIGKFGFPVIGLGFAAFILIFPVSVVRGSIDSTIIVFSSVAIAMISLGVGLYGFLQSTSLRPDDYLLTRKVFDGGFISNFPHNSLSEEERKQLAEEVKAKMTADAAQEISEIWKKEYSEQAQLLRRDAELVEAAQATLIRLANEILSLRKRGSVNLAVGASVSLIGIMVLTGFIYLSTAELSSLSATDVAVRFVVRISLAIFIQLLAYFFLRLYRSTLFEIKYFQNEATNAQFRLLSLLTALRQNDPKLIDKVCSELVKTERNFILKKGESTVALQRETIERDYDAQLNKTIETVLAKSKPASSQG